MIRTTRIGIFADRIIEGGWLLALVMAPYYFSLLSSRHFEPDKAITVRALALVMLAAWAIKAVEQVTMLGERINWRAWWRTPLAIPVLAYGGVFLFTTVTSVNPDISWWGSYNRLQGTYTNLSYIAIFAAIVGNLRRREQIDRLVTTVDPNGFLGRNVWHGPALRTRPVAVERRRTDTYFLDHGQLDLCRRLPDDGCAVRPDADRYVDDFGSPRSIRRHSLLMLRGAVRCCCCSYHNRRYSSDCSSSVRRFVHPISATGGCSHWVWWSSPRRLP